MACDSLVLDYWKSGQIVLVRILSSSLAFGDLGAAQVSHVEGVSELETYYILLPK